MPKLFATGNSEISSREKRNMERARKVASQGMVLLENKGVLPIDKSVKTIALFGNGARRTIKGGTGSGDVNSRFVVNVEQGLEDAGFSLTTKAWMDTYDTQVETARMGLVLRSIRRRSVMSERLQSLQKVQEESFYSSHSTLVSRV